MNEAPYGGLCPADCSCGRHGKLTMEQRFWNKVDKTEDCWLWKASLGTRGYGQFRYGLRMEMAHRVAYMLAVGPIPPGLHIDHRTTCPKNCVNPAHLRAVTIKQNQENRAGAQVNSASGVRGVSWDKRNKKWVVQVGHVFVGRYASKDEAATAARAKRLELFTHNDADRVATAGSCK